MTWTAPNVERTEPPEVAGEREALQGWLDYHRATLLFKCKGLTPEQLVKRSVPPSTLSLLGLIRHMAEVERSWFRIRFAGERELPHLYFSDEFRVPTRPSASWPMRPPRAGHSTTRSHLRGTARRWTCGGSTCT